MISVFIWYTWYEITTVISQYPKNVKIVQIRMMPLLCLRRHLAFDEALLEKGYKIVNNYHKDFHIIPHFKAEWLYHMSSSHFFHFVNPWRTEDKVKGHNWSICLWPFWIEWPSIRHVIDDIWPLQTIVSPSVYDNTSCLPVLEQTYFDFW